MANISPVTSEEAVQIQEVVADYFGLSVQTICGKSRRRTIMDSRHIMAWMLTRHGRLQDERIAKLLNRHVSTITTSIHTTTALISVGDPVTEHIRNINTIISSMRPFYYHGTT